MPNIDNSGVGVYQVIQRGLSAGRLVQNNYATVSRWDLGPTQPAIMKAPMNLLSLFIDLFMPGLIFGGGGRGLTVGSPF
jgi:hypothetical protein